jgi:hypothetical protein
VSIGVWGLREEARKSWQNFISNEIVYLPQSNARDFELSHEFAKQYAHRNRWLEVHATFEEQFQRDIHFKSIIEVANVEVAMPVVEREMDVEAIPIHRDGPVFVHNPEFVQLPEGIIPEGISSVIWLKAVDDICHCTWKQLEPVRVIAVAGASRGETNPLFFPLSENPSFVEMGQLPSQLIEGRPETTDKISEVHGNAFGHFRKFEPKYMPLFLKICLLGNDAVVRIIKPLIQFRLKRIEVFLRPTGFHFDMGGTVTEIG